MLTVSRQSFPLDRTVGDSMRFIVPRAGLKTFDRFVGDANIYGGTVFTFGVGTSQRPLCIRRQSGTPCWRLVAPPASGILAVVTRY